MQLIWHIWHQRKLWQMKMYSMQHEMSSTSSSFRIGVFLWSQTDHSNTHLCVFFEVICTSPNSSWASFHSHTCLLSHHLPLENENACCWAYSACWAGYQESGTGKLPEKTKIKMSSKKPIKYHHLCPLTCMYFFITIRLYEIFYHAWFLAFDS